MTDQPSQTQPADLPEPLDGIDLGECMAVLLDPLSDLVSSIKHSGEKLLAMLLRHEYQRGFAAGWLAAAQDAPAAEATIKPAEAPVGYVVKTRGDDSGRVMISPPGGLDVGRAR